MAGKNESSLNPILKGKFTQIPYNDEVYTRETLH